MLTTEIIRDQKAPRTRIEDLTAVGEELSTEQLRSVVGGLRAISGPTCCSTCSCEYDDQGCGY